MRNVRKTIGIYRYRKMEYAFVPPTEEFKRHYPVLPPPEYIIKTLCNNYKSTLKSTDKEVIKKCAILAIELLMSATKGHLYYVRCHDYQLRTYYEYWEMVLDNLNSTNNPSVEL